MPEVSIGNLAVCAAVKGRARLLRYVFAPVVRVMGRWHGQIGLNQFSAFVSDEMSVVAKFVDH